MELEHRFDAAGICGLCDRCEDPECCEQVECDRRTWKGIIEAANKFAGELRRKREHEGGKHDPLNG